MIFVFTIAKPRRNRVHALFCMRWYFQFYQPYTTCANGHLHIYFFKEYRTSMLIRKQLYIYIFCSAFCCYFTALIFYPHWILFDLSTVLLGTLGPSILKLYSCAFTIVSAPSLSIQDEIFSFSTKASALAFSISKAFSLSSMSAFDFNLSMIRVAGFRTKVVRN